MKWNFILGRQASFNIFKNQCNLPYWQAKEERSYDLNNLCKKPHHIWQNPTLIHYKSSWKTRTRGNFHNLIKSIHQKLSTNIIFNAEILNASPLRLETKEGYLLSPLIQLSTGGSSQYNKARKENRYIAWKRRNKTVTIYKRHDCLYRKF